MFLEMQHQCTRQGIGLTSSAMHLTHTHMCVLYIYVCVSLSATVGDHVLSQHCQSIIFMSDSTGLFVRNCSRPWMLFFSRT